jgi:hypothetical protein
MDGAIDWQRGRRQELSPNAKGCDYCSWMR